MNKFGPASSLHFDQNLSTPAWTALSPRRELGFHVNSVRVSSLSGASQDKGVRSQLHHCVFLLLRLGVNGSIVSQVSCRVKKGLKLPPGVAASCSTKAVKSPFNELNRCLGYSISVRRFRRMEVPLPFCAIPGGYVLNRCLLQTGEMSV